MSDLTGFLLARIAEDEAAVLEPSHGYDKLPLLRARVLAECEAKRELMRIADPYDFADDGGSGMSEHADTILRILAHVYADHPDFRPEWS